MAQKQDIGPFQPNFDITLYLDRWYQIACIPQSYGNFPRATADYQPGFTSNTIKVFNTGYHKNWDKIISIEGIGEQNLEQPALITVSFPGYPIPTTPNYIVHETDYEGYALVGSPDRDSLYVLCRKVKMSKRCYCKFLKQFEKWGYNTEDVVVNYDALC